MVRDEFVGSGGGRKSVTTKPVVRPMRNDCVNSLVISNRISSSLHLPQKSSSKSIFSIGMAREATSFEFLHSLFCFRSVHVCVFFFQFENVKKEQQKNSLFCSKILQELALDNSSESITKLEFVNNNMANSCISNSESVPEADVDFTMAVNL